MVGVLNLNVNGCLVKEILRKLKEKINKGKEFVKKRKLFFLKLRFCCCCCCRRRRRRRLSVDVATKIQILFNILILDISTMQTICHIGIFH